MKRQLIVCGLAAMLIFSLIGASCAAPAPAELPELLTIATMPAGTIVNAEGVGIADICNKYTPVKFKVMPATNEEVWMPLMVTQEVDLGVAVSLPMRQAYLGIGPYEDLAERVGVKGFPLRLIAAGSPMRMNMFVAGDSPGQKIPDLKGMRVVSFAEGTAFDLYTKALLANGGLTMRDVKGVPAANPIEATRAVIEGRADACMVAVGAPICTEAIAKIDARWLPMDPSPGAVKRIQEVIETAYVALLPGGIYPGVPEPQQLMQVDTILVSHQDISEAAVYEITKALWEHNSELVEKPVLGEWTTEKFVSTMENIPYHAGAITFYKERGLWTKEMEEFQKATLAEKP